MSLFLGRLKPNKLPLKGASLTYRIGEAFMVYQAQFCIYFKSTSSMPSRINFSSCAVFLHVKLSNSPPDPLAIAITAAG